MRLFADEPVNILRVPSFRAEHFPYSGPYPWLDRPDASSRIEEKLACGHITPDQAEHCRKWEQDGYIILPRLFDPETIDEVWRSYERAIASHKGSQQAAHSDSIHMTTYPLGYLRPRRVTS